MLAKIGAERHLWSVVIYYRFGLPRSGFEVDH
jgi:hypothetical protein